MVASPGDVDHAVTNELSVIIETPMYSTTALAAMTAPRTRTVETKNATSDRVPLKVSARKARLPRARSTPTNPKALPVSASVSPERPASTSRNSSRAVDGVPGDDVSETASSCSVGGDAASSATPETSAGARVVGATISGVAGAAAVVEGGTEVGGGVVGGGMLAVNEKAPSIGCASPAWTFQRTPTFPPASGGSNMSTKVLPSSVATVFGARCCPVASSATNSSPTGVASDVNATITVSTGSSTTSPSAGVDDSKSVWAETLGTPNGANQTPTASASVRKTTATMPGERFIERQSVIDGTILRIS